MPGPSDVASHYTHGSLLDAIRAGVRKLGKTTETVGIDDLGPVDEFHIGSRLATEAFLGQLGIAADHHVLDVGCGLGGASRFAAHRYGCRVTGVDLTPEFVATGTELCRWVGLDERVFLQVGDATALPHTDAAFDRVYMLHVGMNIADKAALAAELYRVLRPGGKLGIYDIMRTGEGDPTFPVPWAPSPERSLVAPPATYRAALEAAGFRVVAERNRRDFALEFIAQMQARTAGSDGPPPLGLHIVMGEAAPQKVRNMAQNISRNLLAPVELIGEK